MRWIAIKGSPKDSIDAFIRPQNVMHPLLHAAYTTLLHLFTFNMAHHDRKDVHFFYKWCAVGALGTLLSHVGTYRVPIGTL